MSFRQISFVVLDATDAVVDRFTPSYITDPNNLGVQRNIHSIETEQQRFITRIDPTMQDVGMTVWFEPPNVYEQSRAFKAWELRQTAAGRTVAIEYNDGVQTNYLDGIISNVDLTERISGGRLSRNITFHPLSPWVTLIANAARIQQSSAGKTYSFTYPYQYGATMISDNIMENTFYKAVPLKVLCFGFMTNPNIMLLDERNQIYNRVQMNDLVINEGQYLFIDSVRRQILKWNGTEYEDVFAHRDPRYDSYLQLAGGATSKININLRAGENGYLQASRRQSVEL